MGRRAGQWAATRSVESLVAEAGGKAGLARTLRLRDVFILGVGGVVGTGVFVLTGQVAAQHAGPGVVLSFLASGLAAALAGLCYAEFAALLPVAGSAYTYAYATLGEGLAFLLGWNLILEYGVAAATVGAAWSGYLRGLLTAPVAPQLWQAPLAWEAASGRLGLSGAWFNLPAAAILLVVAALLVRGVRLSARILTVMVGVKLTVIVTFVAALAPRVDPALWQPLVPANLGAFGQFGPSGVVRGASILFFAFSGFDAVSTAAQECRRPQRDVPLGMLGSVGVATLLYVAVAAVLTGVVPYPLLNVPNPMAVGIARARMPAVETVVVGGAMAGLASVLLVQIYGQSRIFYAMARDGLLPAALARLHPVYQTPAVATRWVGAGAALLGALLPIELLGEISSIGTLLAYLGVSLGVLVLRRRRPEMARPFRLPGGDFTVPLASAAVAGSLLVAATPGSLLRLAIWLLFGVLFYLLYARRHSRLAP